MYVCLYIYIYIYIYSCALGGALGDLHEVRREVPGRPALRVSSEYLNTYIYIYIYIYSSVLIMIMLIMICYTKLQEVWVSRAQISPFPRKC